MILRGALFVALMTLTASCISAQTKLSPKWEELTAADFRQGILQSKGVCLLPFGILEKHGPHLPLGTDLLNVRYASLHAVEQEYAVVFPEYYFGQIFEARHTHLQWIAVGGLCPFGALSATDTGAPYCVLYDDEIPSRLVSSGFTTSKRAGGRCGESRSPAAR